MRLHHAFLLAALPVLVLASARSFAAAHPQDAPASAAANAVEDRRIAAWQERLLDLAYDAASAMPDVPHRKNRARAQEAVVQASFELGQPQRALRFAEGIGNWRRGLGYADFALQCARAGDTVAAERWLAAATSIADDPGDETGQAWRRSRILDRVAAARMVLGQDDGAAQLAAEVIDGERRELERARIERLDAEDVETELVAIDAALRLGDFERTRGALAACVRLFDRFYVRPDLRDRCEDRIRASWDGVPLSLRCQLLFELAEAALAQDDPARALALVGDAAALRDGFAWRPEHLVPLGARLAELRARAGAVDEARREIARMLEVYESARDGIPDIERADLLRPLAAASVRAGDGPGALALYARAAAEGAANPNARPRADDLVATCCAMALAGCEPNPELWRRLAEIRAGLGEPW